MNVTPPSPRLSLPPPSAGVRPALRVVPLFETLDDLHNAPGTMTTLLGNDWYRGHINGVQECMIGEGRARRGAGGGGGGGGGGCKYRPKLPQPNETGECREGGGSPIKAIMNQHQRGCAQAFSLPIDNAPVVPMCLATTPLLLDQSSL